MSSAQPSGPRRSKWPWIIAVAGLLGLVAMFVWWNFLRSGPSGSDSAAANPRTFDGSSADLKQTVVVPTLDTPIPDGKSVLWCSSFQVAWNHLRDLAGGPVQIKTAEEITKRLNQAEQSEADLAPGTFYATAGWTRDGVAQRIRKEMSARFPGVTVPDLSDPSIVAVAYAYLQAGVPFEHPYFENDQRFLFEDGTGKQTAIRSFGFPRMDPGPPRHLREQPEILLWFFDRPDEFALDLCRNSSPNQIVIARTERKSTLAETVSALQRRMAESPPPKFVRNFIPEDTFIVPNLHWRIEHRFRELEGPDRPLLSPSLEGLHLGRAIRVDASNSEPIVRSPLISSRAGPYHSPRADLFHGGEL